MKYPKPTRILSMLLCIILLISGCTIPDTPKNTTGSSQESAGQAPESGSVKDAYDMELTLNPEKKAIEGTVKIVINNTSGDEWPQISLRNYAPAIYKTLEEMEGKTNSYTSRIEQITDGEHNPLKYTPDANDASILLVALNKPLAPGEKMTLEIRYQTEIPKNGLRLRWSEPESGKLVYELAQFYPIVSIYENGQWQNNPFIYDGEAFYSKIADYSITLKVPEGYTVAASGEESKTGSENGMDIWKITANDMRDAVITVSNYLQKMTQSINGIDVNCYYFDNEAAKKQAGIMMTAGTGSIELFTKLFGAYPYSSLDIIMTGDLLSGVEYPGLVRLMDYSSMLETDSAYATASIKDVTSHEVAHQWFYAVVGNNSYREPWLDESFASFASMIYLGTTGDSVEQLVEQNRKSLTDSNGTFLNDSYDRLGALYTTAVYIRGQIFLYDLMKLMGEDPFYKMMQDYYQTFGMKEAHTQDFVNMVYKYTDSSDVKKLMEDNIRTD